MTHESMFCFQCEQTANCTGCTGAAGACGKSAHTALLQDKLTGALIGLARASESNADLLTAQTDDLVQQALFSCVTNVNFEDETITALIDRIHAEKARLVPDCSTCASPCGHNDDYDMGAIWGAQEDIRSLKSLILFGIRGMAAYAYHASVLGYRDECINRFFYRALFLLGEEASMEELLSMALEVGKVNLKTMELLDKANTESFGDPEPTTVSLTVERGPFIVVSGHDLYDLKCLLEQTEGKGIHIYTHGEMLPANAYPLLKKFPHLKGNFGTAWQNQRRELENIPAPILFTTNCLMPPKASYMDRVFTMEMVRFPGTNHIGPDRDFSPLIAKALELGGYETDMHFTGINGGHSVMTGFGRKAVLDHAQVVVDAVKAGSLRHIFLVGGCDGARRGRDYFTEFVRQTPADSVILTLACGKYRFNDLDLGSLGPLPRLLDMGQCNDAYSAITAAMALAKAFGCAVNDLPLSMILSWYEQKAVCILLTLLHLGIRNIRLGPTLPAFLSPNVVALLAKTYAIAPTTTPEEDLKAILG